MSTDCTCGNKCNNCSGGHKHQEADPVAILVTSKGGKVFDEHCISYNVDNSCIEYPNGTKLWYNESGQLHREDGPAMEYANGSCFWYIEDKLHREGGPAIVHPDGTVHWYKHGYLHREGGPAIVLASGVEYWVNMSKLHREDGPAVVYPDGSCKWYLEGNPVQEKDVQEYRDAQLLTKVEQSNIPTNDSDQILNFLTYVWEDEYSSGC